MLGDIDAFISSDVPEQYARTRYELLNLLKEFRSEAGKAIEVNLYDDIELFSEDASLAEERFGIEPVTRMVREKGSYHEKKLILGAAFKSGLQRVTIPIFEYGVPVEFETTRFEVLRWIWADDGKVVEKFVDGNRSTIAHDLDGAPVLLATSLFNLNYALERAPGLKVQTIKEIHG